MHSLVILRQVIVIDVKTYNVEETLKNGVSVTVRAIRADDKQGILEAFKDLAAETLYSRFFAPKKDLSEKELKQLTEVDFDRTVALVITLPVDGRDTIIGGGAPCKRQDAQPSQEDRSANEYGNQR